MVLDIASTNTSFPLSEPALELERCQIQAELALLDEKRLALKAKYNSLSLAVRIPPEIWAEIFLWCLTQPFPYRFSNALIFAQICRAWRVIAWATPRLWGSVHLCLARRRLKSQKEVLSKWLDASGDSPLSITLTYMREEKAMWNAMPPHEIFQILASHSLRWRDVEMVLPSSCYNDISTVLGRTPILKSLTLTSFSSRQSGSRLDMFSIAPQLRHVELKFGCKFADVFLPWEQLETFSCQHFSADSALDILTFATELVECRFNDMNSKILNIDKFVLTSVSLPRLETLHITGPDPTLFLRPLTTPSLQNLELYFSGMSTLAGVVALQTRSGCSLKRLLIWDMEIDEEFLIQELQSMPSIERLQLENSDIYRHGRSVGLSTHFINMLHPLRHDLRLHGPFLLPRLRVFSYDGEISFHDRALISLLGCRWKRGLIIDEPLQYETEFYRLLSFDIETSTRFRTHPKRLRKLDNLREDGLVICIMESYPF